MTKECHRCRQRKPIEDFTNAGRNKDGKRNDCKECWRSYQVTHREKKKKELFSEYKEYIGFF